MIKYRCPACGCVGVGWDARTQALVCYMEGCGAWFRVPPGDDVGQGWLDATHLDGRCLALADRICAFSDAVFRGHAPPDDGLAAALRGEAEATLVAARAAGASGPGVGRLERLVRFWVTPRLAVAPGPRTRVPEATAAEMRRRAAELPPLPADWRPADPEQRKRYEAMLAGREALPAFADDALSPEAADQLASLADNPADAAHAGRPLPPA